MASKPPNLFLRSVGFKIGKVLDKVQNYLPFRRGCTFLDRHLTEIMGGDPRFPRHEMNNDVLAQLYFDTVTARPKLIVELGTFHGVSTRVLLAAAEQTGATMLSIDQNDCSGIEMPEQYKKKWHFEQSDDVAFGLNRFDTWKADRGIAGGIDVLFIDSSHLYDHTVQEIAVWFPKLSERATVIFHDTNIKTIYRRHDGSVGIGWRGDRAVIRAIEEYLQTTLDETGGIVGCLDGWAIKHDPLCVGYTVMTRL